MYHSAYIYLRDGGYGRKKWSAHTMRIVGIWDIFMERNKKRDREEEWSAD